MNEPTFSELDYIASLLHQQDSRKQGYAAGARWWCLRTELREAWREKAKAVVAEWAHAERITKNEQDLEYPPISDKDET